MAICGHTLCDAAAGGEGFMCGWRESASVIMHGEQAQQPSVRRRRLFVVFAGGGGGVFTLSNSNWPLANEGVQEHCEGQHGSAVRFSVYGRMSPQ